MKQISAVDWLVEQLKEQIHKSLNNELGTQRTGDYRIGLTKAIELAEQLKQLEKEQTDEFAIEFAEWYLNMWHRDDDSSFDDNSPKELLEIFKKEKYEKDIKRYL